MTPDGPDMDMVERLVAEDDSIKGIWCVPKYSNPTGTSYSDETVRRFARLKPAAPDFRIYWDNAYGVHHLYDHDQDHLIEILAECKRAGNPDMVYKFASTSKISFPGSGIAAIATSRNNLEDIEKQLKFQTISHDKVNQLRHVRYFGDIHGMVEHMRKHADVFAETVTGHHFGCRAARFFPCRKNSVTRCQQSGLRVDCQIQFRIGTVGNQFTELFTESAIRCLHHSRCRIRLLGPIGHADLLRPLSGEYKR